MCAVYELFLIHFLINGILAKFSDICKIITRKLNREYKYKSGSKIVFAPRRLFDL